MNAKYPDFFFKAQIDYLLWRFCKSLLEHPWMKIKDYI